MLLLFNFLLSFSIFCRVSKSSLVFLDFLSSIPYLFLSSLVIHQFFLSKRTISSEVVMSHTTPHAISPMTNNGSIIHQMKDSVDHVSQFHLIIHVVEHRYCYHHADNPDDYPQNTFSYNHVTCLPRYLPVSYHTLGNTSLYQ